MAPPTLEIAMSKLGYSPIWVEANFITKSEILDQYSKLLQGGDPNPEHFRYATFSSIFNGRSKFTSNELGALLEIAMSEITYSLPGNLGETLLHSLMNQPVFTEAQLHEIANSHDSPVFRRKCDCQLQLVQLRNQSLAPADIEKLAHSQYGSVQRALLESLHPLSTEHLEYLREHGRTKAVRNIARQRR